MIPANGNVYAEYETGDAGWPTTGRKVLAWDDDGRPLVLGDKGLIRAESLPGMVFTGVHEGPEPHGRPDAQDDSGQPVMQHQTMVALRNYDWLIRNTHDGLEEVGLHWESDTLGVRDGGHAIEEICREGFTPATSAPQPKEPTT